MNKIKDVNKLIGRVSLALVSLFTIGLGMLYGISILSITLGILGIISLVILILFPRYRKNVVYLKYSVSIGFLVIYFFLLSCLYYNIIGVFSIIMIIFSLLSLLA